MESKKPLKIVVVGGSIAGLMHGVMLKRLGHDVHLLEQATENYRHGQAAGIRAGPAVQEFFATFDLYDQDLYALSCPGIQFINKQSKYGRFIQFPMQQTSWTMLYYRLRANFDGLISLHCPQVVRPSDDDGSAIYDLGKRVVSLTAMGNQVHIGYHDIIADKTGWMTADMVIGADGAHSSVRLALEPMELLQGESYAGYLAWRGGVQESQVSQATRDLLKDNFTVFKMPANYILVYTIPGADGSLEAGKRILNFVWYHNCPDESELIDTMTDTAGKYHRTTLQPGMMRRDIWQRRVQFAREHLAAPFVELVAKVDEPFVAKVSDHISGKASFWDGKVMLVGDALALFRPHIALSANQAAYNCLELRKVMEGKSTVREWDRKVLWYGEATRQLSIIAGSMSQFGLLALIRSSFVYAFIMARQKLLSLIHMFT